jgi:hypothetical protein
MLDSSLRDKGLVLAACAIAGSIFVGAIVGLPWKTGHRAQAEASLAASAVQTTPTVQTTPQFSSVVQDAARPPARGGGRQAVATPTPTGRTDCDAMRGTFLRTRTERQWFIDHCLFVSRARSQAAATAPRGTVIRPSGNTPVRPTPVSLTPLPATPTSFRPMTSAAAIDLVVEWITNDSPVSYYVDPQSCNAIWLNGHWVVTCPVSLMACQGAQCSGTISFCVFAAHPQILSDSRCSR